MLDTDRPGNLAESHENAPRKIAFLSRHALFNDRSFGGIELPAPQDLFSGSLVRSTAAMTASGVSNTDPGSVSAFWKV